MASCGQRKRDVQSTNHSSVHLHREVTPYVHKIEFSGSSGTAFVIFHEESNRSFLVTARHIFGKIKNKSIVRFSAIIEGVPRPFQARVYTSYNPKLDIAILEILKTSEHDSLQPDSAAISIEKFSIDLGTEGYFYGFPHGYSSYEQGNSKIVHSPIPLVKSCMLSGSLMPDGFDVEVLIFDGMNNYGFSGGPVICKDSKDGKWKLVGLVSGFIYHDFVVDSLGNTVGHGNSGMILVYPTQFIRMLVDSIE